ncbi:MAG: RidA family protein [bacterium]
MNIPEKVESLGYHLPSPPKPLAAYVPWVRAGDLIFLSGTVPVVDGKLEFAGKVPAELSEEKAIEAARQCALNLLSVIDSALEAGEEVVGVVRVTGYVASSAGYTRQPQVLNGASELFVSVFGEAGKHSREAVGVAELPLGAAVEVSAVIQVGMK